MNTCGNCANADWERTPTGRIKKYSPGRCKKSTELLVYYSHKNVAPCIVLNPPHLNAIWPDYDAGNCPMWARIAAITGTRA